MAKDMTPGGIGDKLRGQLVADVRDLAGALSERAISMVTQRITGATGRLTEYAKQGGGPGLVAAATGASKLADGKSPTTAMISAGLASGKEKLMRAAGAGGKGGKGGKGKLKVTNIVETVDVGVPVRVAYNQWTQFADFPSFMKKVENVDQEADEKLNWKVQIFWSHRTWESTIIEQVPDQRIVWRSKGEKGSVDGTVSFHALAPDLTRILVVLEYHPQGLFERTGNLWRAQGRRVRLELKHFVRHVMTQVVLDPDQVAGWRGEIRDQQVVRDHETVLREEEQARRGPAPDEEYDEYEDYVDEEVPEPAPPRRAAPPVRRARPAAEEPRRRPTTAAEPRRRPVRRTPEGTRPAPVTRRPRDERGE
ncbi:SRPBCC family protein [Micromonospora sp. CPCC 206060]|uniref:SRPBCC family protein n=1 Tax=Micromonospora sp. CPCC 206060 TaxID=3122406 RepID=UPI002FF29F47